MFVKIKFDEFCCGNICEAYINLTHIIAVEYEKGVIRMVNGMSYSLTREDMEDFMKFIEEKTV